MSLRMQQLGSHWTNFYEILYFSIFLKSVGEKVKFIKYLTRIKRTLHEHKYTFVFISCSVLRMRNASDRICRENQKTHILCSVTFSPENQAVYDIRWKIIVERGWLQMTIWRMRIAWWIPKATNAQSEYGTLIASSTAIMAARKRLSFTLYVRRASRK